MIRPVVLKFLNQKTQGYSSSILVLLLEALGLCCDRISTKIFPSKMKICMFELERIVSREKKVCEPKR